MKPLPPGRSICCSAQRSPALARRLGALFVPVETIGLGGRASLPAMLPAREHPPATICVHGPESTGKSVLAERLAERFGTIWVPEYGRAHCELYGTDLDEAGAAADRQVQDAMIRASAGWADGRMFADTDALMTAAWCQMMLGTMPDILFEYAKADLYLMLEPDVPWQGDSVRIYGDAQAREKFRMVCREGARPRGRPLARNFGRLGNAVRASCRRHLAGAASVTHLSVRLAGLPGLWKVRQEDVMTDRPPTPLLDTINYPDELRRLPRDQLRQFADELRAGDDLGGVGDRRPSRRRSRRGRADRGAPLCVRYAARPAGVGTSAIRPIRTRSSPAGRDRIRTLRQGGGPQRFHSPQRERI